MKFCKTCKEPKEAYYRNRQSKDGLSPSCKACDNARKAAWSKANPLRRAAHNLKHWRKKYAKGKETSGKLIAGNGIGVKVDLTDHLVKGEE